MELMFHIVDENYIYSFSDFELTSCIEQAEKIHDEGRGYCTHVDICIPLGDRKWKKIMDYSVAEFIATDSPYREVESAQRNRRLNELREKLEKINRDIVAPKMDFPTLPGYLAGVPDFISPDDSLPDFRMWYSKCPEYLKMEGKENDGY